MVLIVRIMLTDKDGDNGNDCQNDKHFDPYLYAY